MGSTTTGSRGTVSSGVWTPPDAPEPIYHPPALMYFRPLGSSTAYCGAQVWHVVGDTVTLRVVTQDNGSSEEWDVAASSIGWTVIEGDALLLQVNVDTDTILSFTPGQYFDPPGRMQAAECAMDDSVRPFRPARIPEELYYGPRRTCREHWAWRDAQLRASS